MTNEEMEKTIHFIIGQQAQFASDIQRITESHTRLTDAALANTGMIGRLADIVDKLAQEQGKLAQEQAELRAYTDKKMAAMAERLDALGERLDAFIVTVEKYISEGRNGKDRS